MDGAETTRTCPQGLIFCWFSMSLFWDRAPKPFRHVSAGHARRQGRTMLLATVSTLTLAAPSFGPGGQPAIAAQAKPRLFLMAASIVAWWESDSIHARCFGRWGHLASEHASPVAESGLTTMRPLTSQDGDLPGQSTQAGAILP